MEDDDSNNDDNDDNYDNKKDNDGRDVRDFNNLAEGGRGAKVEINVREGARNRQLMKERVEQMQISVHTGVIHATIIALISKRASNNALPRIDLTKLYQEEKR